MKIWIDRVGRLCCRLIVLWVVMVGCGSRIVTPTPMNATPVDFGLPPTVDGTMAATVEASSEATEAVTLTPTETSTQDFRTRPVSGIVTPADPEIEAGPTLDLVMGGVPVDVREWDRYVLRYVNLVIPVPPDWIIREWPLPDGYPIFYSVSVIPSLYRNSQAVLLPEISLTVYRDPLGESLDAWFAAHSSIAAFDRSGTVDPNVYFYEVTSARQARVGKVPALRFNRDVLSTNSTTVLVANGETVATISAVIYSMTDLQRVYDVMLTGIEYVD